MAAGGYETQQRVSEERVAEGDQAPGFRSIAAGNVCMLCACLLGRALRPSSSRRVASPARPPGNVTANVPLSTFRQQCGLNCRRTELTTMWSLCLNGKIVSQGLAYLDH